MGSDKNGLKEQIWVEQQIRADEAWWTEHAGEPDALAQWLSVPENVEGHRALTLLGYEAVGNEHPCHELMTRTLDWYSNDLMDILCKTYWPDVSRQEFAPVGRRYVAVWIGLRVLKRLLGLKMDSRTLSNVLLMGMGIGRSSHAVDLEGFHFDERIPTESAEQLTEEQESVVRAVFDAYDGTVRYPRSLDEVAQAAGIDLAEAERLFGDFGSFPIAEALFEERALSLVMEDVGADSLVTARRYASFVSMMNHNYSGLMKMRVAAQAAALDPADPHHQFFSSRMMRQFRSILYLRAAVTDPPARLDDPEVVVDALTLHALWIGLTVEALYHPHSFDIGAELFDLAKAIISPSSSSFEARMRT